MTSQFDALEAKHAQEKIALALKILKANSKEIKTGRGEIRFAANLQQESGGDIYTAVKTVLINKGCIFTVEQTDPFRRFFALPGGSPDSPASMDLNNESITIRNYGNGKRSEEAFRVFSKDLLKDILPKAAAR